MPPPRKSPPRRRDRRSRSRSHSPRHRRRSRSRSRSRDRRRSRSRSAQRRRSPERKRSPPRRRSPSPRKRSRSPRRRSRSHSPRRRSRSHSPRRRNSPPRRRSPSPGDRNYPVKRPADSSVKRQGYRSRSASPAPIKKSRDERLYREESPYEQRRPLKRSPSPVHESLYGGKMYADKPSSSRQPLFPAGTSKRTAEIDFVTVIERGPKREKLNKRFETLEQAAHGLFDFEENITIGIHRGPQHIELDDDEDIEVSYAFNPKMFKMLFPKKDYVKCIFDRDEIKAFHHDDILDEEAYVEKRTISIKPADRPKSRKYDDELDYKITVGTDREGHGDRRMVHDSRSRSRPSRSSGYDDIPVTVRLDPKPDPRYEKIYREQQRYEDQSLIQEKVHRDPNDLRYNLMRRRSDGDRDRVMESRDGQRAMDARSRIEARRQEGRDHSDRRDRPDERRPSRGSPPRGTDRKKATIKMDLPDFKNRPETSGYFPRDNLQDERSKWGHCSVCNIPLSSEKHALDHVNSEQHYANEAAQRTRNSPTRQVRHRVGNAGPARHQRDDRPDFMNVGQSSRGDGMHRLRVDEVADRKRHRSTDSDLDRRDIKRRSITDGLERVSDDEREDYQRPEDFDELDEKYTGGNFGRYPEDDMVYTAGHGYRDSSPVTGGTGGARTRIVWIIGTEEMKALQQYSSECENYGPNFGLGRYNISVIWNCTRGLRMRDVVSTVTKMKIEEIKPHCIVLHVGRNDIEKLSKEDFKGVAMDMITGVKQQFPGVKLVWSQLLPRSRGLNATRVGLDDEVATYNLEANGHYVHYPALELTDRKLFKMSEKGELDLTTDGILKMMPVLKGGLVSILNRNMTIIPVLRNLPRMVDAFVRKNFRTKFFNKKKNFFKR